MFFDHGNIAGGVFGLLLLALGAPSEVIIPAFAYAWIAGAYPDLGPVFRRDAWRFSIRSEDWVYRLTISFSYSWSEYSRLHEPDEFSSWLVRNDPFMKLHRLVDIPAHHPENIRNERRKFWIYVATAVLGWGLVLALILLGGFR